MQPHMVTFAIRQTGYGHTVRIPVSVALIPQLLDEPGGKYVLPEDMREPESDTERRPWADCKVDGASGVGARQREAARKILVNRVVAPLARCHAGDTLWLSDTGRSKWQHLSAARKATHKGQ